MNHCVDSEVIEGRANMRKLSLVLTVAAAVGANTALLGSIEAAPVVALGQLSTAAKNLKVVEQAQYVWRGRRHCWYNRGWNGPGWYWCGYAWRRGYGWGGPRGWNSWVWSGWGPGPDVVVVPRGRYFYGGRYWNDRYWYGGRWRYR
jgi:hypothetical protein